MSKEQDLVWLVPLTTDQINIIRTALDAHLYERAPEHLRNSGAALDPADEDEDDDNVDLYGESYRDTYDTVNAIDSLLAPYTLEDA